MKIKIVKYKREALYSYTLGMAPTIEMIKHRRNLINRIFIHPRYVIKDNLYDIYDICDKTSLPYTVAEKIFNRLSAKENVYVIGVFNKFVANIKKEKPHVVLVNPSNTGNLGTIVRTGLGFGLRDYAIIRPGVDIYDPKTIRSSMGAFFHVRFSYYDSFDQYRESFIEHKIYPFMLDGKINLKAIKESPEPTPFSLVFGNEGSGLPGIFHDYGDSIYIPHNIEIDSLNLSVAFGIVANVFYEKENKYGK